MFTHRYRALGLDFAVVFKEAISDPEIFGGYARAWGAATRLPPKRKAAALAGLLGNWLLTRRAEACSGSTPWMIGQIERTGRAVMKLSNDPIEWLNRLDSPILPGPFPAPMAVVHSIRP